LVLQIVVASGKGGTGKTTISSSLIFLFNSNKFNVIGVDADVEAPDLIIAMGHGILRAKEALSESRIAVIDYEKCTYCMQCLEVCQFKAIKNRDGRPLIIRELCEGCGTCGIICPVRAINYEKIKTGDILEFETKYGIIISGRLELGRRNSGLLVDLLRERVKKYIKSDEKSVVIIDAAPGIGCPVISSLIGVDYTIIVIEPTRSSLNSANRLLELTRHFRIPVGIIINKYNINEEFIIEIEKWAENNALDILGYVPYDKSIPEAYSNMAPLIEYRPRSKASEALKEIYFHLLSVLRERNIIE